MEKEALCSGQSEQGVQRSQQRGCEEKERVQRPGPLHRRDSEGLGHSKTN